MKEYKLNYSSTQKMSVTANNATFKSQMSFNTFAGSALLKRAYRLADGTCWLTGESLCDFLKQITVSEFEKLAENVEARTTTYYLGGGRSPMKIRPVDLRGEEEVCFEANHFSVSFIDNNAIRKHYWPNEEWLRSQEIEFVFGLEVQSKIGQWDRFEVVYQPEEEKRKGVIYAFFKGDEVYIIAETDRNCFSQTLDIEIQAVSSVDYFERRKAADGFSPEGRKAWFEAEASKWAKTNQKATKGMSKWEVISNYVVIEGPWQEKLHQKSEIIERITFHNICRYYTYFLLGDGRVVAVVCDDRSNERTFKVLSSEEAEEIHAVKASRKAYADACGKLSRQYRISFESALMLGTEEERYASYRSSLDALKANIESGKIQVRAWMFGAIQGHDGRPNMYNALERLQVEELKCRDLYYFDFSDLLKVMKTKRKVEERKNKPACNTLGDFFPKLL